MLAAADWGDLGLSLLPLVLGLIVGSLLTSWRDRVAYGRQRSLALDERRHRDQSAAYESLILALDAQSSEIEAMAKPLDAEAVYRRAELTDHEIAVSWAKVQAFGSGTVRELLKRWDDLHSRFVLRHRHAPRVDHAEAEPQLAELRSVRAELMKQMQTELAGDAE